MPCETVTPEGSSAGNTGALMAMAKLACGPARHRPAGDRRDLSDNAGESVMLDLGANVECDAENLVQFAIMGDVFVCTVLGTVEHPSCGAERRIRGDERHAEIQQASAYLREMSGIINFKVSLKATISRPARPRE